MTAADVTLFMGELIGSFAIGLCSGWVFLYFKKSLGFLK